MQTPEKDKEISESGIDSTVPESDSENHSNSGMLTHDEDDYLDSRKERLANGSQLSLNNIFGGRRTKSLESIGT